MKKIKFFSLIESSAMLLPKMTKKVWVIGIIISILSGGLIVSESFDTGYEDDYSYSAENYEGEYLDEQNYNDEYYQDTYYEDAISNFFSKSLVLIIPLVLLILALAISLIILIGTLISIATYYLNYNTYKLIFNEDIEKVSLNNLVKINVSIMLRVIGGTLLFIVPGIIVGLKYAPINYVLCQNPDIEPKEALAKTRELSKGFKWKMFGYGLAIELVLIIVLLISSPNIFVSGYILLDVLSMLINLLIITIVTVFMSIFGLKLYNEMNNIKNA